MMPLINYPNVPNVPGVPSVLRVPTAVSSATGAVGLLSQVYTEFMAARWGVFTSGGARALNPDSFLEINYQNGSTQSTYPVEEGGFQSYNKVETPFDVRVRMAIGGDQISRAAFLTTVESMLKSLDRFTVVTPEKTYSSASLVNYMYRRETRSGASMIIVELWFQEVRVNAQAAYSAAKSPSSADTVDGGVVQAFPVTNNWGVSLVPIDVPGTRPGERIPLTTQLGIQ